MARLDWKLDALHHTPPRLDEKETATLAVGQQYIQTRVGAGGDFGSHHGLTVDFRRSRGWLPPPDRQQ